MESEEIKDKEIEIKEQLDKTRGAGRTQITSNKRTRSFSSRALKGKISIEKGRICKYCGHKKVIKCLSTLMGRFNKAKCAKCKRWL